MIAVEDCVLVLLAAGRSRRMGDIGSKLDAPFLGRPLGLHVAVALEDMPFRERVAVVGHLRLERGQPVAIGTAFVAEQPVARAHRRLVARGMMRMPGCKRERQPVEKAAAFARGGDEQPVHRGGEPQDGEPLGQRVRGGGGALDADDAALGRGRQRAGRDVDLGCGGCMPLPSRLREGAGEGRGFLDTGRRYVRRALP